MELAIPLIGLGGLYLISNHPKEPKPANIERFTNAGNRADLPNTNIPDKNYPNETVQNIAYDKTAKLSTINTYEDGNGNTVFTDKYFNSNQNNNETATYRSSSQYQSLTGDMVSIDSFSHNNMVPYFGSNVRGRTGDANRYESTLDNYTGSGSQIIKKVEQSPLFKPSENVQHAYGAPNMNDFYQTRAGQNLNTNMNGVKPFESVSVAPGLGLGYGTEGSGGFNSGMGDRDQWLPKTADQLRVASNPKASEYGLLGYETAPIHFVSKSSDVSSMGRMEKNRPDTVFEMSKDRYFTTTGVQKNQPMHAEIVDRRTTRQDTTTDYQGVARSAIDGTYMTGEYMPSKNIELGSVPLSHATASGKYSASEGDYSLKSNTAYPNNRAYNAPTAGGENYFAGVSTGGVIGAVIAPLLDVLRPSRKENTIGSMRPYQNPKTTVSNSYVYNPSDCPAPTIREMTENSKKHYQVNRNQEGGAYMVSTQTPVNTNRLTTTTDYTGSASRSVAQTSYEAGYNQRNNDLKSSTVAGYTTAGNMGLFNGDMNPTKMPNDAIYKNTREITGNRAPVLPVGAAEFGALNGSHQNTVSNIQYERNTSDVMGDILRKNPYVVSYM